jgi:hypothetical protein
MTRAIKQEKLSKKDSLFYSKIAALAGKALLKKYGAKHFSEMAKASHPRSEYHGGRPKKIKD